MRTAMLLTFAEHLCFACSFTPKVPLFCVKNSTMSGTFATFIVLGCGVDAALTCAGESGVEEQQVTP